MAIINVGTVRRSLAIAASTALFVSLSASAQINITGADGQTINLGPNGIDIRSGASHVRLSPGSVNATSSSARAKAKSSRVKARPKVKSTVKAASSPSSSSTVVVSNRGTGDASRVSMQSRNGIANITTNVNGRQSQFTAFGPVSVEAGAAGATINGVKVNGNTGITVDGLSGAGISIDAIGLNGANGITINGANPNLNPNFNQNVNANVNSNFNSKVEVVTSQALNLTGDLAINDNHRNAVFRANNHGIAIYGNHCSIQLQGPCREVAIYGNHNNVVAENVGRISLFGNYNATRWMVGPAPQVASLGKDNQILGPN